MPRPLQHHHQRQILIPQSSRPLRGRREQGRHPHHHAGSGGSLVREGVIIREEDAPPLFSGLGGGLRKISSDFSLDDDRDPNDLATEEKDKLPALSSSLRGGGEGPDLLHEESKTKKNQKAVRWSAEIQLRVDCGKCLIVCPEIDVPIIEHLIAPLVLALEAPGASSSSSSPSSSSSSSVIKKGSNGWKVDRHVWESLWASVSIWDFITKIVDLRFNKDKLGMRRDDDDDDIFSKNAHPIITSDPADASDDLNLPMWGDDKERPGHTYADDPQYHNTYRAHEVREESHPSRRPPLSTRAIDSDDEKAKASSAYLTWHAGFSNVGFSVVDVPKYTEMTNKMEGPLLPSQILSGRLSQGLYVTGLMSVTNLTDMMMSIQYWVDKDENLDVGLGLRQLLSAAKKVEWIMQTDIGGVRGRRGEGGGGKRGVKGGRSEERGGRGE